MTGKTYPAHSWTHPDTEIRPSPIAGNGVFTLHDFEPGDVLEVVGGVVMDDTEFAAFCMMADRYNAIQIGEKHHLVERVTVTQTRKGSINHSCDSNLCMGDENTIIARRSITAGEELTIDYALFTTAVDWCLEPCLCGSPYCRHSITGKDWLKREVQDRYAGQFTPFVNARIRRLKVLP